MALSENAAPTDQPNLDNCTGNHSNQQQAQRPRGATAGSYQRGGVLHDQT